MGNSRGQQKTRKVEPILEGSRDGERSRDPGAAGNHRAPRWVAAMHYLERISELPPTRHLAPLDGDLPHKGGGENGRAFNTSPLVGEVDAERKRGGGWEERYF